MDKQTAEQHQQYLLNAQYSSPFKVKLQYLKSGQIFTELQDCPNRHLIVFQPQREDEVEALQLTKGIKIINIINSKQIGVVASVRQIKVYEVDINPQIYTKCNKFKSQTLQIHGDVGVVCLTHDLEPASLISKTLNIPFHKISQGQIKQLGVVVLDIETSNDSIHFPDPLNFPIIAVGLFYPTINQKLIILNGQIVKNPGQYQHLNSQIIYADSEKQMLQQIKLKGVVVTYNGTVFDLNYIQKRQQLHNIETINDCDFVHVDCLLWVQNHSVLSKGQQGLKAASRILLNQEPFVTDATMIDKLAKEEPQQLVQYLSSDLDCTANIYYKFVQQFIIEMMELTNLSWDQVTTMKAGAMVSQLLLLELFRNNQTIIPKKNQPCQYKGGTSIILASDNYWNSDQQFINWTPFPAETVFQIIDNNIALAEKFTSCSKGLLWHFDVSQMYPSIMLQYAIQPWSWVDELDCCNCSLKDYQMPCWIPKQQQFSDLEDLGRLCQRMPNLFTIMLQKLCDQRSQDKAELKIAKANNQSIYQLTRLEARQLSKKKLINSFYGLLGQPSSIFYNYKSAQFVTGVGRQVLGKAINYLNKIGQVLQADTDGLWVVLPDYFKNITNLNELVNQMVHKDFNNVFSNQLQNNGIWQLVDKSLIKFEFDGPYHKALFSRIKKQKKSSNPSKHVFAKKRYVVCDEYKITSIRGFELLKNNCLPVIKQFQQQSFQALNDCSDRKQFSTRIQQINQLLKIQMRQDLQLLRGKKGQIHNGKLIKILQNQWRDKGLQGEAPVKGIEIVIIKQMHIQSALVSQRSFPIQLIMNNFTNLRDIVQMCNFKSCANQDWQSLIDWEYYDFKLDKHLHNLQPQ